MTRDLLTNIGEEWYTEHDVSAISVTVGVYNDNSHSAGDNLSDTSDIGNVTTEPSTGGNYARASVALSPVKVSGNRGVDNDSSFSFDFSDVSTEQWVDAYLVLYTFDSDEAGDAGAATQHLVANPSMSTDRDIGSIDTLNVSAGDLVITID